MRKIKFSIRAIIEIDEVFQDIEPGHYLVIKIVGIPIARFNQMQRNAEAEEDDD